MTPMVGAQPEDRPKPINPSFGQLAYNKGHWIFLDPSQQQAANSELKPTITCGPPGSGKTTVLREKLLKEQRKREQLDSKEEETILFVSPSSSLVSELKASLGEQQGRAKIICSTWNELAQQHMPDLKPVDPKIFSAWLTDTLKGSSLEKNMDPDVIHYDFRWHAHL